MNGLQIMLDQVVVTYKELDSSSKPNSMHGMFELLQLLTETYEVLKTKRMKKEAQIVAQAVARCSQAFATGYFKPHTKTKLS